MKLNTRLLRNAGGSVNLPRENSIKLATHLISISEMDRTLASLPQKDRFIGSRNMNTERRMTIPALPIDPPQGFRKGFYECLNNSANPFHRRGTEISQGYDMYQLRKFSQSLLQNEAGLLP
jgi:hypothetical protein